MNRKEFTNLLLEWRKNFINERGRFEYLVKKEAVKPCAVIALNESQAEVLREFLSNSNEIDILQDVSTTSLPFGKLISNSEDTRNKLIKFFSESNNEDISRQIMSSNKSEPIIIARALGNNLAAGEAKDNEIFCWLIHDLEHLMYGKNSILGDYHEGWSNWPHAYEDYTIEISNVKEGYPEDNDYLEGEEKEGFLNHLALDKFFNAINFTKEVGGNDFPASIFAYCIIRMSEANDFTEINNTQTLSDEEKQRLKNIFSNAYKSANSQIDLLINKLKDKIFVCLGF